MRILYAGPFSYPSPSANSLRVRGMVKAMELAGHDVTVASWDSGPTKKIEAVDTYSMAEYENGLFSLFPKWIRGLFLGDCLKCWLNSSGYQFDLIILYGTHLGYLTRLTKYCKENKIPLILDVVEWYNLEDLPAGQFGPYAISHEISMRYVAHKADGIIAISKRLEEHFKMKGARVLRIPPLFEEYDSQMEAKLSDKDGMLHLCYVGTPGKKESLGLIVQALDVAKYKGVKFKLHLAGFERNELINSLRGPIPEFLSENSDSVKFYGRIPNSAAKDVVRKCDFSLLIRPDRRSNQFGFPSKMAESMILGTPVIANIFSDLRSHLIDGKNSLLVNDLSADHLITVFEKANRLSANSKIEISTCAKNYATSNFSIKSNYRRIDGFVSNICKDFYRLNWGDS